MRDDMHKVLCEHPRGGWRGKRRSRYRGPIDLAPTHEPISRHRGGTKWLSENLGPLRRWLLAQAGRPWDVVHGELCARIDPRNAVRLHIWQHAQHYVAQRVELVDGMPRYSAARAYWAGEPVSARRSPVYVCPQTGIVRPTPVIPRKRKPQPPGSTRPSTC